MVIRFRGRNRIIGWGRLMMYRLHPDDKPAGDHVCDTCNEECELIFDDCGIGTTEAWGCIASHSDWRWVSECCGDTFTKKPENENDND